MQMRVIAAVLLLMTHEAASQEEASLLVEMHVRSLSCSALAFLAGDYDKYEGLFRLATENLERLLELKETNDKTAASWLEFKDYEIESRDYILGYDYSASVSAAATALRMQVDVSDSNKAKKVAADTYVKDQCTRFEKFIP